jgi:hypothetical protein
VNVARGSIDLEVRGWSPGQAGTMLALLPSDPARVAIPPAVQAVLARCTRQWMVHHTEPKFGRRLHAVRRRWVAQQQHPGERMTLIAILLAGYLALRVGHLVASAIWIMDRGSDWIQEIKGATASELREASFIDTLFELFDGGKLPWLYFGVKSYRLRKWSTTLKHRGRPLQSWLVRLGQVLLWKYFVVPFWAAGTIIALSSRPVDLAARWLLLFCAVLLVTGFLVVVAEAIFAALQMKSWAAYYHRAPRTPRHAGQNMKASEFVFTCATFVILWVLAVVPLEYVADSQFAAHGDRDDTPFLEQIGWALREAATGVFDADPVAAAGWTGTIVDWVCLLSWAFMGFGITIVLSKVALSD